MRFFAGDGFAADALNAQSKKIDTQRVVWILGLMDLMLSYWLLIVSREKSKTCFTGPTVIDSLSLPKSPFR